MKHLHLSAVGRQLFKLIEFDAEEKLLYEIRKHQIGLVFIYFIGLFISIALILAFFGAVIFLDNDPLELGVSRRTIQGLAIFIGTILILLSLLATYIGAYIYQHNVVLVTSDKLTQVIYKNIFHRKISQLSIGDVQDVTVNQIGILARFFNYGTLVIETAGEQQNYTFSFVPNPYEASKAIVNAHEENLKKYGN